MSIVNIEDIISDLSSVPTDIIMAELRKLEVDISDSKFHHVFSAYGLSNFISGAPLHVLRGNTETPDDEMNGIRWNGVFIIRGYVAMVLMRSNHLERGLDAIHEESPLIPFKKHLRAGKRGEETITQHIRNAFSHGSYEFESNMQIITFQDRDWRASIKTSQFLDGLCEQVFRFYMAAYESKLSLRNH